jgi:hypothetical protein
MYNPQRMCRAVFLGLKSWYHLPLDDQADVNKLFGFGYINGGHHKDSARWGWNYDEATNKYAYYAYCHVNGEMIFKQVFISNKVGMYSLQILVENKQYRFVASDKFHPFKIIAEAVIPFTHDKKWAYKLGCYFGGNNAAPKDFTIQMRK